RRDRGGTSIDWGPVARMSLSNVFLIEHPVIQTKLTELRDFTTDHRKFRALLNEIASLMVYEVTRDWPTRPKPVQTPLERMTGQVLARRVTLVPILRAGLGMADGVLHLLPDARLGHLGVYRDEKTLEPVSYYQKLPPDIADTEVLLIDPMLATGGSGSAAVAFLKKAGVKTMKFVCLVAAPEGIQAIHRQHPEIPIYAAAIDRQLNEKGYILPGLGDAGDRIFGT
ncbi:MAG TPA: uracil phosphoribosyltransferase, partial [Tepidisphaeraceae bacterium]|nr:uracil phosphoribosyltransferase [Tepidisphaeraceae bacterium]